MSFVQEYTDLYPPGRAPGHPGNKQFRSLQEINLYIPEQNS